MLCAISHVPGSLRNGRLEPCSTTTDIERRRVSTTRFSGSLRKASLCLFFFLFFSKLLLFFKFTAHAVTRSSKPCPSHQLQRFILGWAGLWRAVQFSKTFYFYFNLLKQYIFFPFFLSFPIHFVSSSSSYSHFLLLTLPYSPIVPVRLFLIEQKKIGKKRCPVWNLDVLCYENDSWKRGTGRNWEHF